MENSAQVLTKGLEVNNSNVLKIRFRLVMKKELLGLRFKSMAVK
jgi:hypothetical protein